MYDGLQPGVKELQFDDGFAKRRVSDLQKYTRILDEQLGKWKKSVDTAREKYYELNYFTTLQLLELRRELGHLAQPTGATPGLNPRVLMLLKSVSPHVSSKVVAESLLAAQHEREATPMDDEPEPEESVPQTPLTESMVESTIMDVSTPTSKRPAPASPKASPSAKPALPTLTYEKLDERQQAVYTTCINFYGYSAGHVLRAFQECGQNASVYDIEEWCEANEDQSPGDHPEEPPQEFEDVTYETDDSDTEEVDRAAALAQLKSGMMLHQ